MTKLVCRDYGFDCEFIAIDDDKTILIDNFGKHMSEVHGIDYPKESLMQFILRKNG